jgi:hypothetical protein
VVRKRSQQVGSAKNDPPGLLTYQPGQDYLKAYKTYDGENGIFILTDEIPDFRMFFQYLSCTKAVWFLLAGMDEIGFP